ncbi:MAG: ABC transporter permease subunit [Bacteroidota bacterium]
MPDRTGLAGLLLFLLIAVGPIGFSLGYALLYSIGAVGLLSEGVTGGHWAKLFLEREIWQSFAVSVYVALVTVGATVVVALPLAVGFRRQLERGPLSYLMYAPLAIPSTVAAFIVFQTLSGAGFFSRIAYQAGWIQGTEGWPELVLDPWNIGVLVAHIGMAVPFFVLLFAQVYAQAGVPKLEQLARTLGAGRVQVVRRVTVPVVLRRSFENLVLLFVFVLGSYEVPLLLGQQSPQMVSVLTMRKYAMFDLTQKPEAFVIAIGYFLLASLLLVWAFRKPAEG